MSISATTCTKLSSSYLLDSAARLSLGTAWITPWRKWLEHWVAPYQRPGIWFFEGSTLYVPERK